MQLLAEASTFGQVDEERLGQEARRWAVGGPLELVVAAIHVFEDIFHPQQGCTPISHQGASHARHVVVSIVVETSSFVVAVITPPRQRPCQGGRTVVARSSNRVQALDFRENHRIFRIELRRVTFVTLTGRNP